MPDRRIAFDNVSPIRNKNIDMAMLGIVGQYIRATQLILPLPDRFIRRTTDEFIRAYITSLYSFDLFKHERRLLRKEHPEFARRIIWMQPRDGIIALP